MGSVFDPNEERLDTELQNKHSDTSHHCIEGF